MKKCTIQAGHLLHTGLQALFDDVRADSKLVRAMEHFVKKNDLSWRLGERSQNVIDGRNGLSTKNTTTLKKSFPKSIKKSSRNPL